MGSQKIYFKDSQHSDLPCIRHTMRSSKDQRLANRLTILQTWSAHPEWGATQIGRGGQGQARPPVVFQQDGAPSHTSPSTLSFLAAQRVQVLPNWPANSPDLNLVENCWAWISRQLIGQIFTTEDALESAIRAAWDHRPPTLIPNLHNSMVRRLTAVMPARGDVTRY